MPTHGGNYSFFGAQLRSPLDPPNFQILVPVHLQRQTGRAVLHDGLEPTPDLIVGLVGAQSHGLAAVACEDGHEDAHELDLAHLHAGTGPRARRPRQERALGHAANVGNGGSR